MAHEVFISYASAEAAAAEQVCGALEAAGIACWMAPRDVRPGSEYAEQLVEAVRAARVFVLVFSKAAHDSEHVRRELDCAVSAGLAVLPVRIEGLEPTGAVQYYLAGRQWCDAFPGPLDPHLEKVCAAVSDLLESKEGAPPTARPQQRKRPSLLIGGAAVLVLAVLAALAVWALMPSKTPTTAGASGPAASSPASASNRGPMTAAQIADKYGPGVVRITANVPFGVGKRLTWKRIVGSGFVASKDGTIFTSFAVVDRSYRGFARPQVPIAYTFDWVTVEFWGAQGQYSKVPGFFFGEDPNYGTALIAVDPRKAHLVPIPLGDPESARTGEPVVALSRQLMEIQSAAGVLSTVGRGKDVRTGNMKVTVLQTNAIFTGPGLGGPLIDASGHVIGVVGPVPYNLYEMGAVDSTGGSGSPAIAVDEFNSTLAWYSRIYSGGRAWDGMDWQDVKPALARALGLAAPRGELVALVDPDGPAARAGIRGGTGVKTVDGTQYLTGGDLVVAIDGQPYESGMLDRHKPGDTVAVTFYRGHKLMTVKIKLDAFPWTPPKA